MNSKCVRNIAIATTAFGLALAMPATLRAQRNDSDDFPTRTPIKHLIVIFQENVSFDHYFATYPHTQPNQDGTRYFSGAKDDTPRVNNLESSGLLTNNPNSADPFRIDRSTPNTCDQDHNYGAEQAAFHGGLLDKFVQQTGCVDPVLGSNSVMGYFDGNTVTAIWNYAQHFAMSDDFFGTTFGPSTPGALNVVSGNTATGTVMNGLSGSGFIADEGNSGAVIGDADPAGDTCSNPKRTQISMSGQNIGDLLSHAGITWGSFMGGFANCAAKHGGVTGISPTADYIPHHAWFQYWASTRNANHVPPSTDAMIGKSDQANHEYDITAFFSALREHHLPAVTYLKAPAFEDGHAGYSDPVDEQVFLVNTINTIMTSEEWGETAIILTYDDSDGWYDHQMGPIVNQSSVAEDQLLGDKNCGTPKPVPGTTTTLNGRCGFGPRLPLLVISPYARQNYVDHRVTDFSSIVRFIEDNWNLERIGGGSNDATAGTLNGLFDFGERGSASRLLLNPSTGVVVPDGRDRF